MLTLWLSDLVQMNVSPASLASLFEEEFKQDMAALKVSCGLPSCKGKWQLTCLIQNIPVLVPCGVKTEGKDLNLDLLSKPL